MKTPPATVSVANTADDATVTDITVTDATVTIDMFGRGYRLAVADHAFWRKVAAGEWEAGTLAFFARALGTQGESVCVDVGAWVGPTALFAAPRCAQVFAVEPDPAAYERLLANLRMNRIANITPCHAAIAAVDGRAHLANHRHFGNSMTRAQTAGDGDPGDRSGATATVLSLRPATVIDHFDIARIDVLKIDIEGGEFALLPVLLALPMRLRPVVHLSLHAPLLPAAMRAPAMATVAELASQYKYIYDADNARITVDTITGETRFRDKFQAVALSDRKLF